MDKSSAVAAGLGRRDFIQIVSAGVATATPTNAAIDLCAGKYGSMTKHLAKEKSLTSANTNGELGSLA
jgi:hypothetical protein